MGEWFIRAKAQLSKLAQAKRLEELLGPGLFDKANERRVRLFRAVPVGDYTPTPGDFLLLTYASSGGFNLVLGARAVGNIDPSDVQNLRQYLANAGGESGMFGAVVHNVDIIDGSFLVEVDSKP
jgi:hypothetical protein